MTIVVFYYYKNTRRINSTILVVLAFDVLPTFNFL